MKSKQKFYFSQLNQKIRTLKSNNSKEYWNLINKSTEGKTAYSKICIQTFMDHFKELNKSNTIASDLEELQLQNSSNENSVLNDPFEFSEILNNIKKLKNNKSAGLDLIKNEFIKKSSPHLIDFYCKLFNLILENGLIPDVRGRYYLYIKIKVQRMILVIIEV